MYDITVKKISKSSSKDFTVLETVNKNTTVGQLKALIESKTKFQACRQSIRLGAGKDFKNVKDDICFSDHPDFKHSLAGRSGVVYLKDLGPQISWRGVFLTEYGGPLVLYLLFYYRLLPFVYTGVSFGVPSDSYAVRVACIAHSLHYLKRELETIFIHRFSNGTMPLRNIFKNSSYYWGFGAILGYYINHPLYTAPPKETVNYWLFIWAIMEIGNFSIHLALRNLRPAGTKVRKIPVPGVNPFTWLFELVTCPNYTYEVAGWFCFSMMSSTGAGLLFTTVGFLQMWVWAKGKRRNYIKEFGDKFPRKRTAIVPFLM